MPESDIDLISLLDSGKSEIPDDRVLIRVDKPPKETKGGLILSQTKNSTDRNIGVVINPGKGYFVDGGGFVTAKWKQGDCVIFNKPYGSKDKVIHDAETEHEYYSIKHEDVLCVFKGGK